MLVAWRTAGWVGRENGVEPGGSLRRCPLLLGAEMRDHLFAEQAQGMEHLVVRCRPDGTEQDHLLDPERFVQLNETDALLRRADAELLAAVAYLAWGRLPRVRPSRKTLIPRVIALVIRRHRGGIVIAPAQAGTLALLFEVPADQ